MRIARVLLACAAALAGATACSTASANSAGVWVEVSPATITAGFQVTIRASCGENSNPAAVTSSAFGPITVQPVAGVLTATVMVPAATAKGTYDVKLSCPTGSRATTTLTVLNTAVATDAAQQPASLGPHTGGGFLANGGDGGSASMLWLGTGLASLLAAAAVAVRTRQRTAVRPARVRDDADTSPSAGR